MKVNHKERGREKAEEGRDREREGGTESRKNRKRVQEK